MCKTINIISFITKSFGTIKNIANKLKKLYCSSRKMKEHKQDKFNKTNTKYTMQNTTIKKIYKKVIVLKIINFVFIFSQLIFVIDKKNVQNKYMLSD